MSALDTALASAGFSGTSVEDTTAPTVPTEVSTAPDQLPYLSASDTSATPDTTAQQSDASGVLSGISDMFATVGTIFTTAYRSANPAPQPKGVTPPPGYYWDGTTGTFKPAPGIGVGSPNTILLVLVGIVILVLVTRK